MIPSIDPIQLQIENVIETEINPMLALHNGKCSVVEFIDGVLKIELEGGCVGCPSSKITLFNGIIPILEKHFDGIIKEVIL